MRQNKVIFTAVALVIILTSTSIYFLMNPYSEKTLEIDEAVDNGYQYLNDAMWDGVEGAYHECPQGSGGLEVNYWGDDNYLALIFHSDYERFQDPEKVSMIQIFLDKNPMRLEQGKVRWCVLSTNNYTQYSPYNNLEYADQIALNGIYYAKNRSMDAAEKCFTNLIEGMYRNGFIEDKATPENGHEYYKLALTLILAHHLQDRNPEASRHIPILTEKLLDLQSSDGSWATDDKDLETTYPNTETTILILLALNPTTT